MTLQRRVLLWLTAVTLGIWLIALSVSYYFASYEINELYDTQQIRLAQQTLISAAHIDATQPIDDVRIPSSGSGNYAPEDLLVGVWTGKGFPLTPTDVEGSIAYKAQAQGFEVQQINGTDWRIYFLSDPDHDRVVAVGQLMEERTEVLIQLLGAYMVPWVLSLPITIAGIAFAVSRAFRPLRQLSADIKDRNAADLHEIPTEGVPADVAPLIDSMNSLFGRITNTLNQERRRTADASHELRSPIAALQAQWDAWNLARDEPGKARASAQISTTIARLTRMVGQLLSLSAVEGDPVKHALEPIRWPVVIENALSDVLPLMERRHGDIEVIWPDKPEHVLPLRGNAALLSMMIRNLLDNALRYGPDRNLITVRVTDTELTITDQGPGMPEMVLSRLGERFVRPVGQQASGSGIGLSIVLRIARMHGLNLAFEVPANSTTGTVVRLRPERA